MISTGVRRYKHGLGVEASLDKDLFREEAQECPGEALGESKFDCRVLE